MNEEILENANAISNENEVLSQSEKFFDPEKIKLFFTDISHLKKIIVSIFILALLFFIYKLLKKIINVSAKDKIQPHTKMILNKIVSYTFYVATGMFVLNLFGVNLSAIWGAAGIAGLAIGFAAQTAVGNIISGMFVLGEKALKVGDFIEVDGQMGTVDSVGLLSVKIHTPNNQMVRIPNNKILDTNLINYSHFGKRRMVFEIPLAYSEDMTKALEAAQKVPDLCPTVLKNPEAFAYYDGFSDAVNLRLAVWFKNKDFIQTKNDVYINLAKVFNREGISIQYKHVNVKLFDEEKVNSKKKKINSKVSSKSTLKK